MGRTEQQTERESETSVLRVGVDVGGTFTDVVLVTADDLVTTKVPTTTPQHEGVLTGIETACEQAGLAPVEVETFVHATTVSVNTLLEGTGADTALVTTEGFRDVLEIGRQARPSLYEFSAEKTPPLVPRSARFEVTERATVDGIKESIDVDEISTLVSTLSAFDSVAISFLHSYAQPENEQLAAEILRKRLSIPVSVSHEVLPEFREYERTSTTVVDAALRPVMDTYLEKLVTGAKKRGLPAPIVMQSNGGVADANRIRKRPVTTVLSGPAAGVVGAQSIASGSDVAATQRGIVTFDMGGTSSDVGLVVDGEVTRRTDSAVAGYPLGTPMVDIETVGSGGGSIAWVDDGGALRVGPKSAGAEPGPVCYGNGGTQPTVTDANVVLGYIGADTAFGGAVTLDVEGARKAMAELAEEAGLDSAIEAATGVYRVANATMTRAIRSMTVERGYDPRQFGLVAFGGAGPLHAPALASNIGMTTLVFPLAGGVLSAYGLLAADEKHDATRTYRVSLSDADTDQLETIYHELTETVKEAFTDVNESPPTVERTAAARYVGQSFELSVPVGQPADREKMAERFAEAHQQAYGYTMDNPVELITLRVSGSRENEQPSLRYNPTETSKERTRTIYYEDKEQTATIYRRSSVEPTTTIHGPAILEGTESTTLLPPEWSGTVRSGGTIYCVRGEE